MYCVEIAFGHISLGGKTVPRSQIALAEQKGLAVFAQCFRGGQRCQSLGCYCTDDRRFVIEQCTVIRTYAQEVESHQQKLLALCSEIANILEQDCVLLTIIRLQGTMQWVEPEATVSVAKHPVLTSPLTLYPETL